MKISKIGHVSMAVARMAEGQADKRTKGVLYCYPNKKNVEDESLWDIVKKRCNETNYRYSLFKTYFDYSKLIANSKEVRSAQKEQRRSMIKSRAKIILIRSLRRLMECIMLI